MKKIACLLVCLVPAVVLSAPDGAFDFYASNLTLLEAKSVQKELGITAQERSLMNSFADADRPKRTAIIQEFQREAQEAQKNHKTFHADYSKLRPLDVDLKKNVLGVLTPSQLKRLREITLQSGDLVALLDQRVAKECGVTPATVIKLRSIFAEAAKQANDVRAKIQKEIFDQYSKVKPKDQADAKRLQQEAFGKFQAKAGPPLKQIQANTKAKMTAMLTSAQKAKLKQLEGKTFSG